MKWKFNEFCLEYTAVVLSGINSKVAIIENQLSENENEFETIDDIIISVASRVASIERIFRNSLLKSSTIEVEVCQPSCCLRFCFIHANRPVMCTV